MAKYISSIQLPGDPVNALDAVPKKYVDNVFAPVRLTSLQGEQKILNGLETWDGVSTAVGDRVLYQEDYPGSGGILVVTAGNWSANRSADMPANVPVRSGALVYVNQGTAFSNKVYAISEINGANTFVPGVDTLFFKDVTGVGTPWFGEPHNTYSSTEHILPVSGTKDSYFFTITTTSYLSLKDGPGESRRTIHVYTQEDATGNHQIYLSPGTVAVLPNPASNFPAGSTSWNPFSGTLDVYTPQPAFSIAYWRFTWLGKLNGGWMAEIFTNINPLKSYPPATWNPGSGSQNVSFTITYYRGCSQGYKDRVLNSMTNFFTAAWRSRMQTAGCSLEVAPRFPSDTESLEFARANPQGQFAGELFGGFTAGKILSIISDSYTQSGIDGVLAHELSHLEAANFFTATELTFESRAWIEIIYQTPLISLWNDCLAAGAALTSNGTNLVEWYAEIRRGQRLESVLPTYYLDVVGAGSGFIIGSETQRIQPTGLPASGSFTLTFNGQTTASIQYNASLSAVQLALENLSNINPGDIVVYGGPLPYTAYVDFAVGRYSGASYPTPGTGQYAGTNVVQMTATGTGMTVTITTVTSGGSVDRGTPAQRFQRFKDHMTAVGVFL